ncbi:DUF1109 domain-containing protein [Noviherbaspirillum galbum]|uniref:DUF1109 domain-containing protein n=1 Tax=Noviherbaspirillum galbum TaxID=2709383 RepID=A0A6B3SJG4_9BURK|nr:DUF1109 domain-containing protein [Noviherbaspirillum galbum]NEX60994.1 DUF1109 domain-containing protein [Noviherbaspirillum galbum]
MKTEEFIGMLAAGVSPVEPGKARRRIGKALALGAAVSAMMMLLGYGARADMMQAAARPMFWMKLIIPFIVAVTALQLTRRLSCPGSRPGRAPLLLAALLLLSCGSAAAMLLMAPPAARPEMIYGATWKTCTLSIMLLAAPVFFAVFWAIRDLAPTRPSSAGAAAGLLGGATAATVYALHCPEMAAPFLGIWYVLGVLAPAALGALLGPRLLRW